MNRQNLPKIRKLSWGKYKKKEKKDVYDYWGKTTFCLLVGRVLTSLLSKQSRFIGNTSHRQAAWRVTLIESSRRGGVT